jgi:hypothetical protein
MLRLSARQSRQVSRVADRCETYGEVRVLPGNRLGGGAVTFGDALFATGFALECVGLFFGVHTKVVGWTLIAYGACLVWKGYLS